MKERWQIASMSNLAHVEVPERCLQALSPPQSGWGLLLQAPMGNVPPGSTGPTWFKRKVIFSEVFEGGGIADLWPWTCLCCLICLTVVGGDNLSEVHIS